MFPGPVFHLELRRLFRRKRHHALLTIYGPLLLYVAWSNNPQTMFDLPAGPQGGLSAGQWHYAGKSLFQDLANWQMAIVVLAEHFRSPDRHLLDIASACVLSVA